METLCSTTPTRDKPTREKLRWAVNSTNLPTISLWAAIWPLCIGDRMGSSLCCLAKRWPLAFCGTSIGRSTSRLTASHSPSLTGQRLQCDCFLSSASVNIGSRITLKGTPPADIVERPGSGLVSLIVRHALNDDSRESLRPVLVVVFFRHIILRHFACLNRALIRIRSIFHAAHNSRFKGLPFFQQFVGALRVHTLHCGYPSEVAATSSRPRPQRSRLHLHGLYILAAHCGLPRTAQLFLRRRSALRRRPFLPA